ncbi:MAG: hypothetical protein KatS3mg124_0448 [Porticoccaceae bacterium]|nr:MAG: hypothetical protein KatS3mg124_0448 [Porticoccaceae bacterium]
MAFGTRPLPGRRRPRRAGRGRGIRRGLLPLVRRRSGRQEPGRGPQEPQRPAALPLSDPGQRPRCPAHLRCRGGQGGRLPQPGRGQFPEPLRPGGPRPLPRAHALSRHRSLPRGGRIPVLHHRTRRELQRLHRPRRDQLFPLGGPRPPGVGPRPLQPLFRRPPVQPRVRGPGAPGGGVGVPAAHPRRRPPPVGRAARARPPGAPLSRFHRGQPGDPGGSSRPAGAGRPARVLAPVLRRFADEPGGARPPAPRPSARVGGGALRRRPRPTRGPSRRGAAAVPGSPAARGALPAGQGNPLSFLFLSGAAARATVAGKARRILRPSARPRGGGESPRSAACRGARRRRAGGTRLRFPPRRPLHRRDPPHLGGVRARRCGAGALLPLARPGPGGRRRPLALRGARPHGARGLPLPGTRRADGLRARPGHRPPPLPTGGGAAGALSLPLPQKPPETIRGPPGAGKRRRGADRPRGGHRSDQCILRRPLRRRSGAPRGGAARRARRRARLARG